MWSEDNLMEGIKTGERVRDRKKARQMKDERERESKR